MQPWRESPGVTQHSDIPPAVAVAVDRFVEGDVDGCLATLNELMWGEEPHADVFYLAAMCQRSRGHLKAAEQAIEHALRSPQPRPEYLLEYGLLLMQLGRHEEALERLREAARMSDDAPEFRHELYLQNAVALCEAGYVDAAILSLHKALKFVPHAKVYLLLGRLLLQRAAWQEAVALLDESVRHFPQDARLYHMLGLALAQGDCLHDARAALQRAVELDAEDPYALLNLARCCQNMGKADLAHELFSRVLAFDLPAALRRDTEARLQAL